MMQRKIVRYDTQKCATSLSYRALHRSVFGSVANPIDGTNPRWLRAYLLALTRAVFDGLQHSYPLSAVHLNRATGPKCAGKRLATVRWVAGEN